MTSWKIAAVQMDCTLGRPADNLAEVRARLAAAAAQQARLVIFPECILTGYCYTSAEEARPHAEPIPGPSTLALAEDCRRFGVWAVVGMLEAPPRFTTPVPSSVHRASPASIARSICRSWASIASRRRAIGPLRCTTWAACASA
jgi:predicted amidohydrolase